ncbi:hypothetical protein NADFUDRAFT_6343, partial [Nadsonia fulvescens var. elongata DSM 6958]
RSMAVFSDFDGTIIHQDTGHLLFDNHGCGATERARLDAAITDGRLTFREGSQKMYDSLNVSFSTAMSTLTQPGSLVLDRGFAQFVDFVNARDIPLTVVSAGLAPVLRGVLDHFLQTATLDQINILSNDVNHIHRENDVVLWDPVWRHPESPLGHDKARTLIEERSRLTQLDMADRPPLIVFIGDGISDLAAASQADILFARKGLALENYCQREGMDYVGYNTFEDVIRALEPLVE